MACGKSTVKIWKESDALFDLDDERQKDRQKDRQTDRSDFLSVFLSVFMSVCLSIFLSFFLSIFLSVFLSLRKSVNERTTVRSPIFLVRSFIVQVLILLNSFTFRSAYRSDVQQNFRSFVRSP